MIVLAMVLILGGVFFLTVSCIGLIRLPDFYSRAHAIGKSETLGAMLLFGGLAVYNGLTLSTVKVLVILVFVLITTPAAIHAISRSALISGLQPWTKKRKQVGETTRPVKYADKRDGGKEV